MAICKVCVAAVVLSAVGGFVRVCQAANEILVFKEVWGSDNGGDFVRLSVQALATAQQGAPITLVVPQLDSTQGRFNVLRVTDVSTATDPVSGLTGAPQHAVGALRLQTTIPGQLAGSNLTVFVAAKDAIFDPLAALEPAAGCTDFGGVSIVGPDFDNVPSNDFASRDATRFFAKISGNLTGTVSVGEIQRFVANGVIQPDGSLVGGNIVADVVLEATKEVPIIYGVDGTSDSPSINFVRLGGGLHGTIRAANAGIFRVIVGSSDSPGLITGTIEAPRGSIGIVECSGDIGGPGVTSQITAGNCIRQIRVNRQEVGGTVVPTDIVANISAGTLYMPASGDDPVAIVPASIAGDVERLSKIGTIGLIESTKDISGKITALNIGRGTGTSTASGRSRDGRLGIVARGEIRAPIHVAWNVDDADIIGLRISGNIGIGNQLNGSIIAYATDQVYDPSDRRSGGDIVGNVMIGYEYCRSTPSELLDPSGLCGDSMSEGLKACFKQKDPCLKAECIFDVIDTFNQLSGGKLSDLLEKAKLAKHVWCVVKGVGISDSWCDSQYKIIKAYCESCGACKAPDKKKLKDKDSSYLDDLCQKSRKSLGCWNLCEQLYKHFDMYCAYAKDGSKKKDPKRHADKIEQFGNAQKNCEQVLSKYCLKVK